ncbi:MAG: HD domain-containing protein [Candidatus Kerfeldbacteria bacterium]|nr:HD domain-containing protein [Candidatus Kerfeldbacteria bacterium]
MDYTDRIYGSTQITEPVITDIMASNAMQRLKKVNQYGASFYRFTHLTTNRFEHCVGVYLLLRKFNATLEEQVAGLLHDVPHTAFSHVVDFVFGGAEVATFHEEFHKNVVMNSQIPTIAQRHGLAIDQLLDKHKFHLLERDLPDVCMDRIDYFFRDLVTDHILTLPEVELMLNDMVRVEDMIVFEHQAIACQFADKYREGDEKLWGHPLQAALYYLFAEAIKVALFENIITFKDLFSVDDLVYDKLTHANHPVITRNLGMVKNIKVKNDPTNYDFYIKTKLRIVDPLVLMNGQVQRLSHIDEQFYQRNETYRQRRQQGYYIRIMNQE